MGLQVRKRTKGKDGWLNFSYSKRNGLGTSASVQAGPFTHNFGSQKRGTRTTTNLGNGFRWVKYGKSPSKKAAAPQSIGSHSTRSYYDPSVIDQLKFFGMVVLGIFGLLISPLLLLWTLGLIAAAFTFPFKVGLPLVLIIGGCWYGWKKWKIRQDARDWKLVTRQTE